LKLSFSIGGVTKKDRVDGFITLTFLTRSYDNAELIKRV
jgi:hypothetical protein